MRYVLLLFIYCRQKTLKLRAFNDFPKVTEVVSVAVQT